MANSTVVLPDVDRSLVDHFEQQVARVPGRVAVGDATRALTYAQLDRAANHIAHALLARSCAAEETVGLLLGHEARMIEAIVGVLKAGKIYVPLDPSLPPDRLAYMLDDAQVGAVVTDTRHAPVLRGRSGPRPTVLNLDELDTTAPASAPRVAIPLDTLCLLIYTSGSTGAPKGVPHSHRNLVFDVRRQTREAGVGQDDRFAQLFSCSFAGAVSPIFGALVNGASVFLFDLNARGLARLPRWLEDRAITICDIPVSAFRHLAAALGPGERFPALRFLGLSGDAVTRRDVDLFRACFSRDCILQNTLGATESRVITQYLVDKDTVVDTPTVPVGYAVEGQRVLLLDGQGQAVPPGEVGEIAVQSEYLSPGYWRKPGPTAAVFLPDPAGGSARIYRTGDLGRDLGGGCFAYLGRKDDQVKIRGYRVEIGEIEMALLDLADLKDACVAVDRDESGEASLVAYVVSAGEPRPTATAFRAALASRLPTYMLPRAFVLVDALPRILNGKVDRPALPAPPRTRPALDNGFVAPDHPIAAQVAGIWEEVLDVAGIGATDDFLELGGDSLRAIQILIRICDVFRIDSPTDGLLEARTVAEQAIEVLSALAARLPPGVLEGALAELELPPEDGRDRS